jgi:ribosomal protein S18 acetylase RimI-like enzyme
MEYVEARVYREKPNVFLCVSDFNHEAQRFYASLGYSVVGVLDDYLVSGLGEVLMRKTIAPITEFP